MRTWPLAAFAAFASLCLPATATIFRVSPSGPATGANGATWSTAFRSPQAAALAAGGGDEIWIAAGTYYGPGVNANKENIVIQPVPGTAVYGGFAGTETSRSQRNPVANRTILHGADATFGGQVGVEINGAGLIPTVIDGLTFEHLDNGILCYTARLTTSHNAFVNCTVRGIGLYNADSLSSVDHNRFQDGGEGVAVSNCFPRISDNVFLRLTDGVYCVGTAPTIVNNTMVQLDRGVYWGGSHPVIANNVIVSAHYALLTWNPTSLLLKNNCLFDTDFTYSGVGDPTGQNGNIKQNPMFVNPALDDYRLQATSPCRDSGNDAFAIPNDLDAAFKARVMGAHIDIGAYEFNPWSAWTVSTGTTVRGGVLAVEGVAYLGGDDGKLRAYRTVDGSSVAGFPVDISAAVGASVKLTSRPAVYYGKTGKAIYLSTDRGDVVRVLPNGTVAWHVRPLNGPAGGTPAVTAIGDVFATLSTGSGPNNNFLFKLDEATGSPRYLSPYLGTSMPGSSVDSSPAVTNRYAYVNAGSGQSGALYALNLDNLTVRSSLPNTGAALPPFIMASDIYLATKAGRIIKASADSLIPDLRFGGRGWFDVGEAITAAPLADPAGTLYLGTGSGRVLTLTSGLLSSFASVDGTAVGGLTIDSRSKTLGYGTAAGNFVQVPLGNPGTAQSEAAGGAISTPPAFDLEFGGFIVVTDDGRLLGYPTM